MVYNLYKGSFVAVLFKRFNKMIAAVTFSILVISGIEIMQYILNVGVFDIDDIILNSLGCFIGFKCYEIIKRILGADSLEDEIVNEKV